jgi:UrcA family protein
MYSEHPRRKMLSVFFGLAAGALIAPAAMAQEAGSPTTYVDRNGTPEEVTIMSPHRAARSAIGAPIEDVSMSAPVGIGDLNLHTGEGVYTMRQRVKYTAHTMCNRLSFRYPIGYPDTDRCYRRAIERAMPQADSALWNYRSPM